MTDFIKKFSLIMLLLLVSCSNFEVIPTKTTTTINTATFIPTTPTTEINLIDISESVDILPKEGIEDIYRYSMLISPDGEKVALVGTNMYFHEQDNFLLPIISLENHSLRNEVLIQLDRPSTLYLFKSWSPDGTAFAGTYFDIKRFNGSDTCCGEAIAITNIFNDEKETSTYSWDWNNVNSVSWSTNSSFLSVDFQLDDYKTLILNRQGELLKTLDAGKRTSFWLDNILYYRAQKEEKIELWSLDVKNQDTKIIFSDFGNKHFVAQNEKTGEVLLTDLIINTEDYYLSIRKFYILNLNTREIDELKSVIPNTLWVHPVVSSNTQEYVAFDVSFKQDESLLWIFDWKTHEFNEYGQIKHLLGWINKFNGFLVISLNDEQKIVKP